MEFTNRPDSHYSFSLNTMKINSRFLSQNDMPAVPITEGSVYKEYSKSEETTLDFPIFHNKGSANKWFKGVWQDSGCG